MTVKPKEANKLKAEAVVKRNAVTNSVLKRHTRSMDKKDTLKALVEPTINAAGTNPLPKPLKTKKASLEKTPLATEPKRVTRSHSLKN